MNPEDTLRHGRRSPYRFTMVPHWVLLMTELSDAGYRVYSLLLSHVNNSQEDGKTWPNQKTLAEMLGRRREAVGRVIREELEPLGLITVKQERYGTNDIRRRNAYYVHEEPPPGAVVYESTADWRSKNGKNADEDGCAENRSPEGAENRSSPGVENRASGGAENRTGKYTNVELDQGRTTRTADAVRERDRPLPSPELEGEVDGLCAYLADKIKEKGVKRPKITYAWRDAVRSLLEGDDGYSVEEVREVIRWAQEDPWWASRTMTMRKLAQHFGTILVQARGRVRDSSTQEGKKAQQDVTRRRMELMGEFMERFETKTGRKMNDQERKALLMRLKEEVQ